MREELFAELVKLAGQRAFDKGLAYFQAGRVARLVVSGDRITARVDGSHAYTVELRKTAQGLDGFCDCPASEGIDFCKHCVATALAVEDRQSALEGSAGDGPGDRIRAYLSGLPSDALVDIIIDALDEAPGLEQRLRLQADAAAGLLDAKRLKKTITAAIPLRHVHGYRESSRYFERAEACLEGLVSIAPALPPDALLAAAMHGFARLNKALERVDDSGGRRWGLQYHLQELHKLALQRLDWTPEQRAVHLLKLTLDDPWDTFNNVLDQYGDVLGESGRKAWFTAAQAELDRLPALSFGADFEEQFPHLRLTGILADQARAANDTAALIELARRTCTTALDCYRIASLYLEAGDTDQALCWLDKGDDAADDRARDAALRVAVHSAREEWGPAADAQLAFFTRTPGISHYQRLEALARRAGHAERSKREAIGILRNGLGQSTWRSSPCALTLAWILHADGEKSEAAELVLKHVQQPQGLLSAADWFEAEDPSIACDFVERAVESHVSGKNNASYKAAVELLRDSRELFSRAAPRRLEDLLTDLRRRHKAKRNLQAMLNDVFA